MEMFNVPAKQRKEQTPQHRGSTETVTHRHTNQQMAVTLRAAPICSAPGALCICAVRIATGRPSELSPTSNGSAKASSVTLRTPQPAVSLLKAAQHTAPMAEVHEAAAEATSLPTVLATAKDWGAALYSALDSGSRLALLQTSQDCKLWVLDEHATVSILAYGGLSEQELQKRVTRADQALAARGQQGLTSKLLLRLATPSTTATSVTRSMSKAAGRAVAQLDVRQVRCVPDSPYDKHQEGASSVFLQGLCSTLRNLHTISIQRLCGTLPPPSTLPHLRGLKVTLCPGDDVWPEAAEMCRSISRYLPQLCVLDINMERTARMVKRARRARIEGPVSLAIPWHCLFSSEYTKKDKEEEQADAALMEMCMEYRQLMADARRTAGEQPAPTAPRGAATGFLQPAPAPAPAAVWSAGFGLPGVSGVAARPVPAAVRDIWVQPPARAPAQAVPAAVRDVWLRAPAPAAAQPAPLQRAHKPQPPTYFGLPGLGAVAAQSVPAAVRDIWLQAPEPTPAREQPVPSAVRDIWLRAPEPARPAQPVQPQHKPRPPTFPLTHFRTKDTLDEALLFRLLQYTPKLQHLECSGYSALCPQRSCAGHGLHDKLGDEFFAKQTWGVREMVAGESAEDMAKLPQTPHKLRLLPRQGKSVIQMEFQMSEQVCCVCAHTHTERQAHTHTDKHIRTHRPTASGALTEHTPMLVLGRACADASACDAFA